MTFDANKYVEEELAKLADPTYDEKKDWWLDEIAETLEEPEVKANFEKSMLALETGDYSEISALSYDYYDDDCCIQACEDFPRLDSSANYELFADGPQESNHSTAATTRIAQRICCDGTSIDFPSCPAENSNEFVNHSVMQFYGMINIPPKCVIDHAHLRLLASDEQPDDNLTDDGTCYIAATIENPNQVQTPIQLSHLENHCLWRDIPIFTGGNYYNTANIGPAIQDIVNLDGWNGNRFGDDFGLVLAPQYFVSDGRHIESAVLHVYWHQEIDEDGTGGVLVGGSSLSNMVLNEDGSGGVLVGGASLNNTVINEIASGGVVLNGVAVNETSVPSSVYNETGSGGVVCGGHAGNIDFELVYNSRTMITVPAGSVNSDLTKFLLSIATDISPVSFAEEFYITDSDENVLASHIRSYSDGKLIIDVKTDLKAGSDNIFYIYHNSQAVEL